MHTTSSPIRRIPRLPGVVAVAAVLAMGVAPAQGVAKPKKPVTTKCDPGSIKTETKGKGKDAITRTWVCNTDGKWVEVLFRTQAAESLVAVTLAVPDPTTPEGTTPTPPPTSAQKPKPVGSSPGCVITDGVTAATGETMTVTQYVRDAKGNVVSITHTTYKCGADGNWTVVPRVLDPNRMANIKNPELVR